MIDQTSRATAVPENQWTILRILRWGEAYLAEKQIGDPRLTTELLLGHALACDRVHLYTHFDQPLTRDELGRFKSSLKRKLAREPVQYILGDTIFMGLRIKTDRRALIPRPETEELVERAITLMHQSGKTAGTALDVGTGTGCIAIALATFLPAWRVESIDVDSKALELAAENVELHQLSGRIRLRHLDFLTDVATLPHASYDVLVSNPPYIPLSEHGDLEAEVAQYEPRHATTDGGNGLKFFTAIAKAAPILVRSGGVVCVEIGYGQSDAVMKIFNDAGMKNCEVSRDFQRVPRIVSAQVG